MKMYYRFFGGFLDTQENWLNQMANRGYRLIRTGKISYEFEECQPGAVQYAVEFVAHQSYQKEKEYRAFLEEIGYRVFYKNANLNYSVAKIKWRPYGRGMGQISTNPGSYNKELLIVEKKNDGKPFELHTTHADKSSHYKPLRNTWVSIAMMFLAFAAWSCMSKGVMALEGMVFGGLGLASVWPVCKYQKRMAYYAAYAKTEE